MPRRLVFDRVTTLAFGTVFSACTTVLCAGLMAGWFHPALSWGHYPPLIQFFVASTFATFASWTVLFYYAPLVDGYVMTFGTRKVDLTLIYSSLVMLAGIPFWIQGWPVLVVLALYYLWYFTECLPAQRKREF